ncbi:MAG: hypothetical protein P4L03_00160 [Terracidiphilus sp.]|nr:hypothetical protein [Terracidiphilus sp.]
MRRALAITLLSVFSWMLIAPLLAPSAEASLPPCCRRHGKHHCSMMTPLTGSQRGVETIQEKCPFTRVAKGAAHTVAYRSEPAGTCIAPVSKLLTRAPQTITLRSTSLDRSCPKRGPPALFL